MAIDNSETTTLAGGCFWCVEAVFLRVEGIRKVTSGYTGGSLNNPTYEEVCSESTGHAEAVQVEFYPKIISFEKILDIFFTIHDPTTLNYQGYDIGTRYRSAIFTHSESQHLKAEQKITELEESKTWPNPIVTELSKLSDFFVAENYHQNYFDNNINQPYCQIVVSPKIDKLNKKFKHKLKN